MNEILEGRRVPGTTLRRINEILNKFGLVLVIAIETDDESKKPTGANTRLWIERRRRYDANNQRTNS